MVRTKLLKLIKEVIFTSQLLRRRFLPMYRYNFTAPQLCFLCQCIEKTKNVPGNVAEIGCGVGGTTVFLNKYMDAQEIEKDYFAIDTFSGFTGEDIKYEVSKRGKDKSLYTKDYFALNKKKWFDATMRLNNINRVKSIQADVNDFDISTLGRLSFCLLDVDLYRPIKKSLRSLYDNLSDGGLIIVDDCNPNNIMWDGADQAYKEFMEELSKPVKVIDGKLGIIEKHPNKANAVDT